MVWWQHDPPEQFARRRITRHHNGSRLAAPLHRIVIGQAQAVPASLGSVTTGAVGGKHRLNHIEKDFGFCQFRDGRPARRQPGQRTDRCGRKFDEILRPVGELPALMAGQYHEHQQNHGQPGFESALKCAVARAQQPADRAEDGKAGPQGHVQHHRIACEAAFQIVRVSQQRRANGRNGRAAP